MSTKRITTKVVTYDKPGGEPKPPGTSLSLDKDEADRMIKRGHASEGGAREPEPAKKPAGDTLTAALAEAIGGLDKGDEELWTNSGKPNTKALEAVLGYPVSAAERDAAWAAVEASAKAAEAGKDGDKGRDKEGAGQSTLLGAG